MRNECNFKFKKSRQNAPFLIVLKMRTLKTDDLINFKNCNGLPTVAKVEQIKNKFCEFAQICQQLFSSQLEINYVIYQPTN